MFRPHLRTGVFKTVYIGLYLLILFALFTLNVGAASPPNEERVESIIEKMKAAYAQVEDYQMQIEVKAYREGQVETKRFLYTFKKPNHIRIDMESPNRGTVLVYPDKNGKVVAKPGGLAGFLKLHLSLDSALLRNSAGQHIDQTDLGLLIQNIAHSVTDQRQGEVNVSEQDGRVVIEVLAADHFLPGVSTLYQFSIDSGIWLPVGVRELTPDGILKRDAVFRDLKTSTGIPESFFQLDGRKRDEQHGG